MQSKAPKSDEWMKVHITIIEKDADCAQISAAFTWLTRPSFRMRDVMGLSIIHGTIVNGTAKGFYRYMLSNGYSNTTTYTSGFDIVGAGIVHDVTLYKSDSYSVTSDYSFIQTDIYKEGGSEGVNGTYGHQRMSISFSPDFSIDEEGTLSIASGLNIGMYYDQFTGYDSVHWIK